MAAVQQAVAFRSRRSRLEDTDAAAGKIWQECSDSDCSRRILFQVIVMTDSQQRLLYLLMEFVETWAHQFARGCQMKISPLPGTQLSPL